MVAKFTWIKCIKWRSRTFATETSAKCIGNRGRKFVEMWTFIAPLIIPIEKAGGSSIPAKWIPTPKTGQTFFRWPYSANFVLATRNNGLAVSRKTATNDYSFMFEYKNLLANDGVPKNEVVVEIQSAAIIKKIKQFFSFMIFFVKKMGSNAKQHWLIRTRWKILCKIAMAWERDAVARCLQSLENCAPMIVSSWPSKYKISLPVLRSYMTIVAS